jgi:tetratricopeptide (TPR) repeat protein
MKNMRILSSDRYHPTVIAVLAGLTLISFASCVSIDAVPADAPAFRYSEFFPAPRGDETALIAGAPSAAWADLSYFGPTVPIEVSQVYKAASGYYDQGSYEEADVLSSYLFQVAANAGATLSILQIESIITIRAFAAADSGQTGLAEKLYQYRLDILYDDNNWQDLIPAGISVTEVYDETLRINMLSDAHRDRALLAQATRGSMEQIVFDMERAIQYSVLGARRDNSERIQRMIFQNLLITERFLEAQQATQKRISEFENDGESIIAEVLFAILRMAGIAAVNLDDLPLALEYYGRILEITEMSGFRDGLSETDIRSYDLIDAELKRRGL